MEYIKSTEIDPFNTFFHFSRIDNRDSIELNGLQSVAGGENGVAKDRRHKTIYFSKGIPYPVAVWQYGPYSDFGSSE